MPVIPTSTSRPATPGTADTGDDYDVIVCGAGMVGAALGYGMAGAGLRVLALDGADLDYRAAKANFGLVWVQGKGFGNPDYQALSRRAARQWPDFARELTHETGIGLDYDNRGGLHFCVGEAQWQARADRLAQWHAQLPDEDPCTEMLERSDVQRLMPGVTLGSTVTGASFGHHDGHVNPLYLLAALQRAFVHRGGVLRQEQPVSGIAPLPGGGFHVQAGGQSFGAARVVIAAGLGSAALGRMVGLDVPVSPQRGQVMVTERVAPWLPLPASGVRQTGEGTVMVGLTQENVGLDTHTTTSAAVTMSRRAIAILPQLAGLRWIRQWSCLRIMTPDGCPVYAESPDFPGAFIALCHSGVTLAAIHAGPLAHAMGAARLPAELDFFLPGRFHVPQAA